MENHNALTTTRGAACGWVLVLVRAFGAAIRPLSLSLLTHLLSLSTAFGESLSTLEVCGRAAEAEGGSQIGAAEAGGSELS